MNLLPSVENLWKRKVVQEPTCQMCGNRTENIFHALIVCNATLKIQKTTQFADDLDGLADQDMLSIIHGMARWRGKTEIELLAALFWSARNQWLFKGKRADPMILVANVEAMVDSYRRIQVPLSQT